MNNYTPSDRRRAYRNYRIARNFQKALPFILIAYVLIALVYSGTSDYASGIR